MASKNLGGRNRKFEGALRQRRLGIFFSIFSKWEIEGTWGYIPQWPENERKSSKNLPPRSIKDHQSIGRFLVPACPGPLK